jgi:hypothetical protein
MASGGPPSPEDPHGHPGLPLLKRLKQGEEVLRAEPEEVGVQEEDEGGPHRLEPLGDGPALPPVFL